MNFPLLPQGWTKKAERIQCPAPLPEDPAIPLLTRMLVLAPYQAPEKKAKKKGKEAKGGLRRKGTSDAVSGIPKLSPPTREMKTKRRRRKKKMATFVDPEAEASKRGKISLSDGSDSDAEAIPKRRPRTKPLAES